MISEMPLPIPRSEICSPIHMMKAVPVVRVRTLSARNPHPGCGTIRAAPVAPLMFSSHQAMPSDWTSDSATVP